MAIVPSAGRHVLNRPMRSFSSSGINDCTKALLWHVAIHSELWLEARSNSPLLFTRISKTWNMLMGHSAVSLSLFDVRQSFRALDQACAVVNKVMSQRYNNLLPMMLVKFCSQWWSNFPDVRRSLLRYLTKLAATRLGTRHPQTVILFHLVDENVAAVCIDPALQMVMQTAEREPPLLDQSALSLRHAYCCMLIDHEQYLAAVALMTWLRDEALKLYGRAGVLTRCALLRKGEIHIGLGAPVDAKISYEEVLQLSEGQHHGTALDAVGIEAATQPARLNLTSGDPAGAQHLCKKALRNPWTLFSKPGLKGMGLTLKVTLEEILVTANSILEVREQQTQHLTLSEDERHEDHGCQAPMLQVVASQVSNDYIAIRASVKDTADCSMGTTLQMESETRSQGSSGNEDPFIMNPDHVVRRAVGGGGGSGWNDSWRGWRSGRPCNIAHNAPCNPPG